MNHLTIDPTFAAQLLTVNGSVELRDDSGRVIGHFTPLPCASEADIEKVRQLFDLEKAKRVLETERGQGRPLAEIWKRLRAGENQG